MRSRLRLAVAALLSFAIYLVPIVGPHAFWLLGEHLFQGATRGDRPAAWLAADFAAALAMQLTAGAIGYWICGRPRSLRPSVLLLVVPAFFAAAQWCYLRALPTWFLIERDTANEGISWTAACTVPGETLAIVGSKPAIVRAGDPLFVQDSTGRLAHLTVAPSPDGRTSCAVTPLAMEPTSANDSLVWIGADDRGLRNVIDQRTGAVSWLWVAGHGVAAVPLPEPLGRRPSDPPPLVSHDGNAIAWLAPAMGSGQPSTFTVIVYSLPSRNAQGGAAAPDIDLIGLSALGTARFTPLDLDTTAREVTLAIDERRFAAVGFDGGVRWGPLAPDGVVPLSMTFRRLGEGWVAWDGYKDNDAYVLAWALRAGNGRHRVPKGRSITDVGVHPDGRLIALSVTTSLSIGAVRDAVYVLRVADGAEVFRRYLPRYTRSSVLFPSRDLFAYSEWDGTRAATVVLRIPADALR